jgi:hypothetical protein
MMSNKTTIQAGMKIYDGRISGFSESRAFLSADMVREMTSLVVFRWSLAFPLICGVTGIAVGKHKLPLVPAATQEYPSGQVPLSEHLRVQIQL